MKNKERIIERLQKQFPNIHDIHDAEEFDGSDGIHLGNSAEGGTIDDIPACDYYYEDYNESLYIMGVHKKLVKALNREGLYAECYDPGTYIAYED